MRKRRRSTVTINNFGQELCAVACKRRLICNNMVCVVV